MYFQEKLHIISIDKLHILSKIIALALKLPSDKVKDRLWYRYFLALLFFGLFFLFSLVLWNFFLQADMSGNLKVKAASNDTVNFQGKVVNKVDGTNVVTGSPSCVAAGADTCDFRVRYYSAATGGTLFGTEEFLNVEIGDYEGIFKLALGTGTYTAGSESSFVNIFLNNASVYMEIGFDPAGGGSYT